MRIIVGTALLLATAMAFAQRVPLGVPLPGLGGHQDRRDARAEEEEQDALTLTDDGKRDGDDKLTCEQLQAELTTLQADPQMQALMATSQQGAAGDQLGGINQAQQLLEQMQANRPSVAGTMVKGMAQSLNPFGQIGAKHRASRQQAEMEAQIAEIQKSLPAGFPVGGDGQPAGAGMPLMMRAGHVIELAQAKKCDWMSSTQSAQQTEPARERQ
jgi:hypothetical protein